jgi:CubicO group peptidase (beta-lactamase class C family)
MLVLFASGATRAHSDPFSPSQTTTGFNGQVGPTDATELESFLDEFFAEKLEELHIPGAAFVMVKDGDVFFKKGYGYADLDKRTPVDPDRTVFRTGSVSKLFTWTAAMQMVEKGSLELDADVNQYLTEFQLPATYSSPVTLHHLMTHTAGFEDRWIGYKTYDEDRVISLGQFLASNTPNRVIAPGSVHSYSNYGTDLGGYLVAEVSGTSFSEYAEKNIFQPLGMVRSTFRQPMPESLVSDLAVGYWYENDNYEAAPFMYSHSVPADGLSTTAADMALFMIAHLQDGQYRATRILQEATARQMHSQQFAHHPELPGMSYGFKERYINGQRVIGHGGDIPVFSGQLILLPEHDEGFFVVYNKFDDALREDLIRAFFARYYPPQLEPAPPEVLPMTQEDLARFTGRYRWVRYPRSTVGKLIALIPGPHNISLESNDDGGLSMTFFGAEAEWRYVPVEPLVFKQVSGGLQRIGDLQVDPGDTLVFREDDVGRIAYGFASVQNTAFEKLSWYESPESMLGTFGALAAVFLSPLIVWPIGGLLRRVRKHPSSGTGASKWARWLAGIASGLNLIFMAVLLFTFGEDLVFGMSPIILGLLTVPIITSLLAVVLLGATVLAWIKGYWSIIGRAYYSLITLAALVFVAFANYWNLLGYRF